MGTNWYLCRAIYKELMRFRDEDKLIKSFSRTKSLLENLLVFYVEYSNGCSSSYDFFTKSKDFGFVGARNNREVFSVSATHSSEGLRAMILDCFHLRELGITSEMLCISQINAAIAWCGKHKHMTVLRLATQSNPTENTQEGIDMWIEASLSLNSKESKLVPFQLYTSEAALDGKKKRPLKNVVYCMYRHDRRMDFNAMINTIEGVVSEWKPGKRIETKLLR